MPPIKKVGDQEVLIPSKDFPYSKFKFDNFNPVQSRVFEYYDKDCNVIIAANTSSGKTVCAEMFVWDELKRRGGTALYLAPMKALAKEKIDDWTDDSHGFAKMKISICSGDFRLTAARKKELEESDIILMTSEMINSRCRNYESEHNEFLAKIGTVIVDECFDQETLVLTECGYIPIGAIIDGKMRVRVASLNHITGALEYKQILGWKKKKLFRKWYSIYYHGGYILVTENQLIWVFGKGYIPAQKVEKGDFLYANWMEKQEEQASCCVEQYRNQHNLRDVVGRRVYRFDRDKKICEGENQSGSETESICRVEVRAVEAVGWNPACHKRKWWMGGQNLHIYNSFLSRNERNLQYDKHRWEKNDQSKLAGSDNSSHSFGGLVYGRWESREIANGVAHGVFSPSGSGDASQLAKKRMESGVFLIPIQELLDHKIYSDWSGSISENYQKIYYSEHEVQTYTRDGGDLLLDVREAIFNEKETGAGDTASNALWERSMLGEMDQNDETDRSVEEASICCDLEIEDNHNFFVKQVGSNVSVLAHNSHILTVPSRGDHLEVGLMKLAQIAPNIRIVFLSATMPNAEEIANWVSYSLTKKDTVLLESEFRPCPLGIHFETYEPMGSYEATEEEKVASAMDIILDNKEDKFLVFAHTKRTGYMMQKALQVEGIAAEFHNADLDKNKRQDLETRFRGGDIPVVVATSTLAWGCYRFGTPVVMEDGSQKSIEDVAVGDGVLSLEKNHFVSKRVVKTGTKIIQKAIRIVLSSGESIDVSENHPLFAAIGRNHPDWVEAVDVSVNDYIGVPRGYNFPKSTFNRLGYLYGYMVGDGCLYHCGHHADGEEKIGLDITFGAGEKIHIDLMERMFREEFEYSFKKAIPDLYGVLHLRSKKRELTDRFRCVLPVGRKGAFYRFPEFLWKNRDLLRGFLSGLFDADGGVEDQQNNNWSVGFCSISEELVRQVQHALLTFGVRSDVGKKRMKDSCINGRLQVPRREYIWRLRAYNHNIISFRDNVGFMMDRKKKTLDSAISDLLHKRPNIDHVPVRGLLKDHAEKNGISGHALCKKMNVDLWASLHRQDLTRATVKKIIDTYPVESGLSDLYNMPVLWKKVVSVEFVPGGEFQDLEIEHTHNYVGAGVISHNCNLPARRVIILGVTRGLTEVDTYDIWQMAGRAGRPGFDPRGDVYILMPDHKSRYFINKLQEHQPIISRLLDYTGAPHDPHYKTLAFHLISEIHHGYIKRKSEIKSWYEKSLAHFQAQDLDDKIVDATLDLLIKCGAVKEEDGILKATIVGTIASMFYYSPFDVADLRRNFKYLFDGNLQGNDVVVSMCLGNVDSLKMSIVNKDERAEMLSYKKKIVQMLGENEFTDGAIKSGFAYYSLLNGEIGPFISSVARMQQWDFPRLAQVLVVIDKMSGKWGQSGFLNELQLRIAYGVRRELLPLCSVPDIGKIRATKLWESGIRSPKDMMAQKEKLGSVLGFSSERVSKLIDGIKLA